MVSSSSPPISQMRKLWPGVGWECGYQLQGWPGIVEGDSCIQSVFVEHLLSTSHCPRHWAVMEAHQTLYPGGVDILSGEIQTGNE